jgi:hypothetical protein
LLGHFTGKFHNKIGQGQAISFSAVDMYTIKNGKIKSNWHLEDMQTLMQQFLGTPLQDKSGLSFLPLQPKLFQY